MVRPARGSIEYDGSVAPPWSSGIFGASSQFRQPDGSVETTFVDQAAVSDYPSAARGFPATMRSTSAEVNPASRNRSIQRPKPTGGGGFAT
jgi:hypothetical protein